MVANDVLREILVGVVPLGLRNLPGFDLKPVGDRRLIDEIRRGRTKLSAALMPVLSIVLVPA